MNGNNAGLMRRLAAIVYDFLLMLAFWIMSLFVFVGANRGEAVEPSESLPLQITFFVIAYVFLVGYWTKRGRTLGMQSWGLQLESMDGGKPTFAAASVRFLAAIVSWAPCGLGFLWQLWDRDRLTWHDRISGTRLVHYPKTGKQQR